MNGRWEVALRLVVLVPGLVVAACGGSAPTPPETTPAPTPVAAAASASARATASASVTASPSSDASPLPLPKAALAAGRYTKPGFVPGLTFTVGDGWTAVQAVRGFFDIEQKPGAPDVIAVQFANVDAESLGQAVEDVTSQPNTKVVDKGDATIDDRPAFYAVIETTDPADSDPPIFRPVLDVAAGPISIASGRRLKVVLVEVTGGVLGVLIGGAISNWDDALATAQPVVDSLAISD